MFQEYGVVIAKNELPGVPVGSIGTILIVFDDGIHFEVEFVDDTGLSLGVITVNCSDIEKAKSGQ